MLTKPLISIIIPAYNRAHLIGETIESIQKQTYQNWECIVVDDRSTDTTEEVVRGFMAKDSRFSYYMKPKGRPQGPSAARNYGFEQSKGEYINFFDSDDLMHPQKLEIDLKNIQSGDYDFTISQSKFFNENGEPTKEFWNSKLWSDDPVNDFITKNIGWGVNSPLWKKDSLIQNNVCFGENLITADDYFFHFDALSKGLIPHVNNEVFVKLREHENRLNDFKNKSPFKLFVAYSLLKNKSLGLKKGTINHLLKMSLKQLSKCYKNKSYKVGVNYTFKLFQLRQSGPYNISLLKLLLIGTFYKISNVGYRFFNIDYKIN